MFNLSKKSIVLFLILVAVASTTGWFLVRETRITGESLDKTAFVPVQIFKKPVDDTDLLDTSKWKTYRNEEYGFEVKYPEEWKLLETFEEKGKGTDLYFGDARKNYNQNDTDFSKTIIVGVHLNNNPILVKKNELLDTWRKGYDIKTYQVIVDKSFEGTYYTGFGEGMLMDSIDSKDYEFSISIKPDGGENLSNILKGMIKSIHFF